MVDEKFRLDRYASLYGLWCHHNATQLQWPAVVIGAVLLVISAILPDHLSAVVNYSEWGLWGKEISLAIGAGIPISLTGLGMLTLLYTMGRARRIMINIESEIVHVDKAHEAKKDFRELNHIAGPSGPKLIRGFMAGFLALPLTFFGLSFLLGLLGGSIAFALIFLMWTWIELIATRSA